MLPLWKGGIIYFILEGIYVYNILPDFYNISIGPNLVHPLALQLKFKQFIITVIIEDDHYNCFGAPSGSKTVWCTTHSALCM